MLSPKTIKEAIGVQPIITPEQLTKIQSWHNYYNGTADHNTRQKNPIPALMISKTICGEVSRNVTAEMIVEVQGNDYLNEQMQAIIDEWDNITEKAAALGETILRPFVYNDKILVNAADRTTYFPVRYAADGTLEAVVFVEYQTVGDYNYILFTLCDWIDGTYTITNTAWKSSLQNSVGQKAPLTEIEAWKTLEPSSVFYTSRPLFVAYTAPNSESVFANAVEMIKEADFQDSRITWENEAGETVIFASSDMFKDTGFKNPLKPKESVVKYEIPEGKERLYNVGNYSAEGNKIQTHSPSLRNADLLLRRDDILRTIESIVGLRKGILSRPAQVEKTATEVEAGAKPFDVLIGKYKDITKSVLEQLIVVIDEVAQIYSLPSGYEEIVIDLGDSLLISEEQKQANIRENTNQALVFEQNGKAPDGMAFTYWFKNMPDLQAITKEEIEETRAKFEGLFVGVGDEEF